MLFAHLKRILGLGKPRLRSPSGARDEFLLAATAPKSAKAREAHPLPEGDLRNVSEAAPFGLSDKSADITYTPLKRGFFNTIGGD
jgi:hypothetical protein